MTHPRKPGTFKTALTETIRDLGGAERVASALGVGRSTVDAWKNPSRNNLPSSQHLIEIERMYVDSMKTGPSPCLLYILSVSLRGSLAGQSYRNLMFLALEARKKLDHLIEAALQSAGDDEAPRAPDKPTIERELAEVTARLLAISS